MQLWISISSEDFLKKLWIAGSLWMAVWLAGCSASKPAGPAYKVYVTNEASGDLTIIDPEKQVALATVPLGKRARGLHPSPDNTLLYVALSGSPLSPPGVDESTLPPPDKSADGIGIFDIAQGKMLRKVPGGSDPEEVAISKDG
jgi:YVTN family beta-propeller protein